MQSHLVSAPLLGTRTGFQKIFGEVTREKSSVGKGPFAQRRLNQGRLDKPPSSILGSLFDRQLPLSRSIVSNNFQVPSTTLSGKITNTHGGFHAIDLGGSCRKPSILFKHYVFSDKRDFPYGHSQDSDQISQLIWI